MKRRTGRAIPLLALAVALALVASSLAWAGSQYVGQIPSEIQNKSCTLCHTANYPELNAEGKAWAADGKDWSVFSKAKADETKDSGTAADAGKKAPGQGKKLPKTGSNLYLLMALGSMLVAGGSFLRRRH